MSNALGQPERLDALGAVNFMLDKYGESRVSRLKATASAVKAEDLLAATSVSVQSEGWSFCRETDRILHPDGNGHILIPADYLEVLASGPSRRLDLVVSDGRLLNRDSATRLFAEPVTVTVTRALPWADLPAAASWYILLAATVSFIVSEKPDDASLSSLRTAMQDARIRLEHHDARLRAGNLVLTSPHFRRHRRKRG